MTYAFHLGRRRLLTGGSADAPPPVRPPWSSQERVLEQCERCGACADACPQSIIVMGDGGFPEIDFQAGECTFCRACADACPAPVFDMAAVTPPFSHVAAIGADCFAARGIACQSCGDACPEDAIHFTPRLGAPPAPRIEASACTGCGACTAACPADAIGAAWPSAEKADG